MEGGADAGGLAAFASSPGLQRRPPEAEGEHLVKRRDQQPQPELEDLDLVS
jgi:hypothetical protein